MRENHDINEFDSFRSKDILRTFCIGWVGDDNKRFGKSSLVLKILFGAMVIYLLFDVYIWTSLEASPQKIARIEQEKVHLGSRLLDNKYHQITIDGTISNGEYRDFIKASFRISMM
jgi:hypothetical protein